MRVELTILKKELVFQTSTITNSVISPLVAWGGLHRGMGMGICEAEPCPASPGVRWGEALPLGLAARGYVLVYALATPPKGYNAQTGNFV